MMSKKLVLEVTFQTESVKFISWSQNQRCVGGDFDSRGPIPWPYAQEPCKTIRLKFYSIFYRV